MTTLINLYGGPGIGKSTVAAEVYATLKGRGVNAELVREYVKGWVWEGRKIEPLDQLYFWGKQVHAETTVIGKADVVVTDSPVMLAAMYLEKRGEKWWDLACYLYGASLKYYSHLREDAHRTVNVILNRYEPYEPSGRFETNEQAMEMDKYIQVRLDRYGVNYDRGIGAADVIELANV